MSFIAGPYTATYDALALGQSQDGWRLTDNFFKQLVLGDKYAQAPQDAVYQGAEVLLAFTLIEYDAAAVQSAMWPYNATLYINGQVGRTDVGSAIAKQIIFTSVVGTPAAALPATATFPLSIIAENFPKEILYAPALRTIPMRMRVYPNQSTGSFGTLV